LIHINPQNLVTSVMSVVTGSRPVYQQCTVYQQFHIKKLAVLFLQADAQTETNT